jgi:type IV pilus assembly protein PilA
MRSRRGFTLIELAIVVVIVGVLAVLAIVGYRRYAAAGRLAEANNMVAGIAKAEHEWKSERGVFFNVSDNAGAFYPNPNPGPGVTAWGLPCSNCAGNPNAWNDLRVHADAPVLFGYSATAAIGVSGGGGPVPMAAVAATSCTNQGCMSAQANPPPKSGPEIDDSIATLNTIASTQPWFLIVARADYDGNGVPCTVVGMSHSNTLIVEQSGE